MEENFQKKLEEVKEGQIGSKKEENVSLRRTSKWAKASFICGLLPILLFFWMYPGFPNWFVLFIVMPLFGVLAFIFGIIGLSKGESRIYSLVGIIIGGIIFFIYVKFFLTEPGFLDLF